MPEVRQKSDQAQTTEDSCTEGVRMRKDCENTADEIRDLKQSLESFEREKERV